jgi:hypothetical protein
MMSELPIGVEDPPADPVVVLRDGVMAPRRPSAVGVERDQPRPDMAPSDSRAP